MSMTWTRRRALQSLGLWMAGSPLLEAQHEVPKLIGEPPGRITPREELVNTLEVDAVAQRVLPATVYAKVAGSDRRAFDRMTFRPRMLVPVRNLDLSVDLFGTKHFAPILVGPASRQARFHPDGELALVRGAAAGKGVAIISSHSSQPIEKIAGEAKDTLWYQVYPEPDMGPVIKRVQAAVQAGCKVVCLTVGTPYLPAGQGGPPNPAKLATLGNPALDWGVVDQVRQAAKVPVLLKGIMSPEEAQAAVQHGASGIIVSNHGGRFVEGLATPIEVLTAVVDGVGGKAPVLIDSNFRRGSDVVKALALGAKAVLVARPALWGLAAYGGDGVRTVLELLQSETARTMALCGKPTLASLDRTTVQIHRR
jgi:4-hydroxymandelate oxidase